MFGSKFTKDDANFRKLYILYIQNLRMEPPILLVVLLDIHSPIQENPNEVWDPKFSQILI